MPPPERRPKVHVCGIDVPSKAQYTRANTRTSVFTPLYSAVSAPSTRTLWIGDRRAHVDIWPHSQHCCGLYANGDAAVTNQEHADEQPVVPSHISPFERIWQVAEDGGEYWLGRDLATVLDYAQWQNFEQATRRAIRAARNSGQAPADH